MNDVQREDSVEDRCCWSGGVIPILVIELGREIARLRRHPKNSSMVAHRCTAAALGRDPADYASAAVLKIPARRAPRARDERSGLVGQRLGAGAAD